MGLLFAVAASVLGAIPALFRALTVAETWVGKGLSFTLLLGLYFFGGLSGGFIVGALRRITHLWWGRRVVGILAATPLTVAIMYTAFGIREWTARELSVLVVTAIVWGGTMSFVVEVERARRV